MQVISFGHFSAALSACCLAAFATPAMSADNFPDKPIHWVVGEAPGGTSDVIARLISAKMAEKIGQPVVVLSKPGASGTIAAGYVAHAAPGGYDIFQNTANNTVPPFGFKTDYDPITSFTPITEIGFSPFLLVVNPQVPVNTLQELIAYAKANPNKLNLGADGPASTVYWSGMLLQKRTGIQVVNVTFSGGGPTQVALLGNEVQMTFSVMSTGIALVKSGKLKALAITGTARSPLLPDVPTFVEAAGLHDFDGLGMFYGMLAPAGTPKPIIDKLHDAIVAVVKSDDFRDALAKRSLAAIGSTPEEFAERIKQSTATWSALQSATAK